MEFKDQKHSASGDRVRSIKRVLWVILFLNFAVAFAKYTYGVYSKSAAMQADGIHSLFDGTSNIIGLVAMSFAARPADHDHPYGHSKYETYASAIIGIMLLFAAYTVGSTAVQDLVSRTYHAQVNIGSFIVMIGTLLVNISVTTWERRVGKQLGSEILVADASHTMSDVMVSIGVIVGLVFVKLGFPVADPIVALFVSGAILYTAYGVFKQANATLSDSARIPIEEICDVVTSVKGVLGCHRIRTRGSEAEVYVDLHIEVDGNATVNQGHSIADAVEQRLLGDFDQIVDAVIHMEPFDPNHKD